MLVALILIGSALGAIVAVEARRYRIIHRRRRETLFGMEGLRRGPR